MDIQDIDQPDETASWKIGDAVWLWVCVRGVLASQTVWYETVV